MIKVYHVREAMSPVRAQQLTEWQPPQISWRTPVAHCHDAGEDCSMVQIPVSVPSANTAIRTSPFISAVGPLLSVPPSVAQLPKVNVVPGNGVPREPVMCQRAL